MAPKKESAGVGKNEIVAGKEDNAAVAMIKKKLNLSYLKRKGK